ncbi:unnamed protein product, partial [Aphanomyces euteiches]
RIIKFNIRDCTLYANYHALRRTQGTHEDIPNSLQLRPLSEIHWDQPTQILFNPFLPSNSHFRDTKLRLSPISPSIRPADIAIVLAEHVFDNTDVDITGTVATLTFFNSEIRDIAWQAWRTDPLVIRDSLSSHRPTPTTAAILGVPHVP